jgi:EmrB/QacA subfamily drug resistance transporter
MLATGNDDQHLLSCLIGVMSAEPASVPESPVIPARQRSRDPREPARSGIRMALILVASFMVVLDFTIVNIALPSIETNFHISTSAVQWVVTGYAIAFSGLLILGGRAADLLGRRRMFVIGLIVFSLASLAGGFAQDPVLLVASRIVQGAGAAVVAPAALSLITVSVPPGRRRTRAIGLYGSMASVGFVAGQVLGGVLVQWISWRAVFLVNVPIGLAVAFLAPRVLAPDSAAAVPAAADGRPPRPRLDVRGAALITGAVTLAVFCISQGGALGWTSPLIIAALAVAIAAGACFPLAERNHPQPLVRPRLLLRPGIRDGAALAFLLGIWNGGELLVLSLYFQTALHDSPVETGLIIAPQGIMGFLTGLLAPRIANRIGVRRVLVLAGVAATIGFGILILLPSSGYNPLLLAVIPVGFAGAGTAFGSIVLTTRELSDSDQGLAGGLINTSRQVGAAVGAALLPAVAESVPGGIAGISGDRAAMIAATAVGLAAAVISWNAARHGSGGTRAAAGPETVD